MSLCSLYNIISNSSHAQYVLLLSYFEEKAQVTELLTMSLLTCLFSARTLTGAPLRGVPPVTVAQPFCVHNLQQEEAITMATPRPHRLLLARERAEFDSESR